MLIGVPKEIKTREFRVGLVPSSVAELVMNIKRPVPPSRQIPLMYSPKQI
jgi:hypothetical protein